MDGPEEQLEVNKCGTVLSTCSSSNQANAELIHFREAFYGGRIEVAFHFFAIDCHEFSDFSKH